MSKACVFCNIEATWTGAVWNALCWLWLRFVCLRVHSHRWLMWLSCPEHLHQSILFYNQQGLTSKWRPSCKMPAEDYLSSRIVAMKHYKGYKGSMSLYTFPWLNWVLEFLSLFHLLHVQQMKLKTQDLKIQKFYGHMHKLPCTTRQWHS